MTPKEKAIQLIDKFNKCMPFKDTKLTSCDEKPELIKDMELLSAKQCATIAVEEIEAIGILTYRSCGYLQIEPCHKEYWKQVKQEIELL